MLQAVGDNVIVQLIKQEKIERIVMGVSEGKIGQKAKEYGKKLGEITGLEVALALLLVGIVVCILRSYHRI